ncbi:MAG: hypothetical protein WB809_01475 [Thermoplasmata archaeon]
MAPIKRAAGWVLAATFLVLFALVIGTSAPLSSVSAPLRTASTSPVTAVVMFNGVAVGGHTTAGSAIVTNFSGVFSTVFTWNSTSGTAPVFVTEGVVSLLFLGVAIGTSTQQQPENGHGVITLKSDFTQNRYLFEGNYEIQATLQSNGTTVFTQDFYIWVQATDHLTLVNIVLLLIAILEIWQIAALGSVKKARTQLGIPPPASSSTPSSSSPSPSSAPPPASPPPSSPPSSPPPTGGT